LDRVTTKETQIQDLVVPAGTVVTLHIYAIHHDPKNWPDPERFDPERFRDGDEELRKSGRWIPFGGGPRSCELHRRGLHRTCRW
jgi:cytochrome P450